MDKPIKYKYRHRPGYGSDRLLIEFVSGVENEAFGADLFDAIKEINPKLAGREDLWMNDEILYTINSDLGQFTLSKDIWDFVFLMADDNQTCILQINNLLLHDNRFEKMEVDFNDFKLNENASS
ncbi:MAG: hypothetical protein ACOYPR_09380 [Saprospiraceae bacterium]